MNKIKVNYQNSISINDEIFIDPLKIDNSKKAKLIFITHPHYDHFSSEDIKKIITPETIIICPKSMENDIILHFNNKLITVEPDNFYDLGEMKFETHSSYNLQKSFHPRQNKWVGYSLFINDEKITIIGDSDVIPEHKNIKTDILLIPIGGHYTMDLIEASELANEIHPKKVIPTHYGEIVGNKEMGDEFKKLINDDIECELQL